MRVFALEDRVALATAVRWTGSIARVSTADLALAGARR